MKIFAVITVARQVDGEYIFIKTEKGFASGEKADQYLNSLKNQYATPDGKWKPQLIQTASGEATCQCEVGIFELEVEN